MPALLLQTPSPPPLHSSTPSSPCPQYFMCIHCFVPLHTLLPLLVPRHIDPVSSLRAMLESPRQALPLRTLLCCVLLLSFMTAVCHSVWSGLMYVSVFPTGKLFCLLCPVSAQHGAFFLVLSSHLVNRGCLTIREGPQRSSLTFCFYRIEAHRGEVV